MPKKTKQVEKEPIPNSAFCPVKQIQFSNFTLFGKNRIEFKDGINLINYFSYIDKELFNYILESCLNPQFMTKNKFIDHIHFTHLLDIQIDTKKSFSFETILNIFPEFLNNTSDFLLTFVAKGSLKIEIEIQLTKEVTTRLFDNNQHKYVKISPVQEFNLYELVYKEFWIDNKVSPYFNIRNQIEIMNYNKSEMFEFIANLLNLNRLKERMYGLQERIHLANLETVNLNGLKAKAEEKKESIEQSLAILSEIDKINEKLQEYKLEKEWSRYFDLKNKFEGKVSNIEQNKSSLSKIQAELDLLESQELEISKTLDDLKNSFEAISVDYDNKRKKFLTEKAQLDRIDRNLKDWDSSVNKVEKEIKFRSMKLKDKEKKLKDLESRLAKSKSDELLKQKTKLENDIKKDKSELSSYEENLNAVKNEQKLKSKEKNIKEKNSQPANSELVKIADQMNGLTQKINEKEKEIEKIKIKLKEDKITSEKIQTLLKNLEKEIKVLDKEIQEESKKIKAKSLSKPKQNRSSGTIQVLETQLQNEKSKLLQKMEPETNHKTLSEHIEFMKNLDSDISKRNTQLKDFKKELTSLEKNWKNVFGNSLNSLVTSTNDLLKVFKIKIEMETSKTTLPEEGALLIKYNFNEKESKQSYQLSELIVPSFIVLNTILLSSMLNDETKFIFLDIFDILQVPKEQFEEFLGNLLQKISELKNSQVLILNHENKVFSSSELQNLNSIN